VKIAVLNLGQNNYNFVTTPIDVGVKIIDPFGQDATYTKRIISGTLLSGRMDTLEIVSAVSLTYAGQYDITAWVSSSIDNIPYDDTITYIYSSGRVELPIDEYFNGDTLPYEFIAKSSNGKDFWEIYHPDLSFAVQPNTGGGMLRYAGEPGTVARLSVRPLDMYGAANPKMEFWYYHDTTMSPLDNSYTEVIITAGGISSTVLYLFKRIGLHGWQQYTVDLRPYTTTQCVLIDFESMNMGRSGAETEQYIDHIFITSDLDLEVSKIFVTPEIAACDLENRDIHIVLHAATNHNIDFSIHPTHLTVEISGYADITYPLTKTIAGYAFDTIVIPTKIDFTTGIYTLKAYLSVPIDENSKNDTTSLLLDIRPDIKIEVIPNTGGITDCIAAGIQASQQVTITNSGNLDVQNIPLVLEVHYRGAMQQTLYDTLRGVLQAGNERTLFFAQNYTVPKEAFYNIVVSAELDCDIYQSDNTDIMITECVDLDDIAVVALLNPPAGSIDDVGSIINLEVRVENLSPIKTYPIVIINAHITDEISFDTVFTELITNLEAETTRDYKFNASYSVPAASSYMITVFVNSEDNYLLNDTITVIRQTVVGVSDYSITDFSLGQNIPNPAQENTRIEYSIPTDGQVIFTVYSITGQTLYIEKKDAYSGKNDIKFNTANLADGVYFYSMEYNGERLVKRMTIRK